MNESTSAAQEQDPIYAINAAANKTPLAPWSMVAALAMLGAELLFAPGFMALTVIFWAFAIAMAHVMDRRRSLYALKFKLESKSYQTWQKMQKIFERVLGTEALWQVTGEMQVSQYVRDLGGNTLIDREACRFGWFDPAPITSDTKAFTIQSKNLVLAFYPDRVYVKQGTEFKAVSYRSLQISIDTENRPEGGKVPKDAPTIGRTWKHYHANGMPDKALSSTNMVPVVQYTRVTLRGENGVFVVLLFSNPKAAQALAEVASEAWADQQAYGAWQAPKNDFWGSKDRGATALNECLEVLGLTDECSRAEATSRYRELARLYHPDQVAHLAPELRDLAVKHMTNINEAYSQLRAIKGW